jgi:metallophosphoesterase (TIGR03767 family)
LTLDRGEDYAGPFPSGVRKSLINIVHISDTHICDAQSPGRVEYLDRFADPHHPISKVLETLVGTYRAQESMTTQVLESAVQAINRIESGPITKRKIDTVLITGDVSDNAQTNELKWFTTLLNGGKIKPDSGSQDKWEGAGGTVFYSPYFWHPHGTPSGEKEDFPRSLYGFPLIPELLEAIRAPFYASGLNHHWMAVHGNHDALLQGTVVPDEQLRTQVVRNRKIFEISDEDALSSLQKISEIGPAQFEIPASAVFQSVSADDSRVFVSPDNWNRNFYREDEDNGIAFQDIGSEKRYWRKDFDQITMLALDTVNPDGGWQGSLDCEQFEWLKNELSVLENRYVLITSHHPLQDLINSYTLSRPRVLAAEIEELLIDNPQVIAWICGHTHRNRVMYFGPDNTEGFWQIETSSLIDWPQQGRIIEIFIDDSDQIWIANTMFNHLGALLPDYDHIRLDEVNEIAGLSRVLAVNDWQRREGQFSIALNQGNSSDRNAFMVLPKRI